MKLNQLEKFNIGGNSEFSNLEIEKYVKLWIINTQTQTPIIMIIW